MFTEALQVLVKMQDADGGALGSSGNGQIGQGVPVYAMGTGGRQFPHRRQGRSLNAAITGISRMPSSVRSTVAIPSDPLASNIHS